MLAQLAIILGKGLLYCVLAILCISWLGFPWAWLPIAVLAIDWLTTLGGGSLAAGILGALLGISLS